MERREKGVRIEGEAFVEDGYREFIRGLSTARCVLEVEEAIGLGVEAKERNGRLAVVAQELAIEAE